MRTLRPGVRAVAGLAMAIAATGCATRVANIDHRMLLPSGGDRVELQPRELFVMPIALVQPEPVFPPRAAGAAPVEVTVCAELWLSADGDVGRILPYDGAPGCAANDDAGAHDYASAVDAALRRWEFTPAMICEFAPEQQARRDKGDCTGPDVAVRRVPVRLNYAFTFSNRDGKRRVGIARSAVR